MYQGVRILADWLWHQRVWRGHGIDCIPNIRTDNGKERPSLRNEASVVRLQAPSLSMALFFSDPVFHFFPAMFNDLVHD